ncbi:MAG: hypothetical protein AB7E36_05225 [Salinivirgaceae bacterium]
MRLFICLILMVLNLNLWSQDVLFLKNGEKLNCTIVAIDTQIVSVRIQGLINDENHEVPLSQVDSMVWNKKSSNYSKLPSFSSLSSPKDSTPSLDGNYLYLFTGTIISGKTVDLKQPFIGYPYLLIDEKKIDAHEVKFFSNDEGFFANTIRLQGLSTSFFARRVRKGHINLYERTTYNATALSYGYAGTPGFGGHGTYGTVGGFGVGASLPHTKFYYNKGFDDLKHLDFYNLRNDMADNPLALSALNHWNQTRKKGNAFLYSSLLVTGVSFIAFTNKVTESGNSRVTVELAGLSLGISGLIIKYLVWDRSLNPQNLKKSIDMYNR